MSTPKKKSATKKQPEIQTDRVREETQEELDAAGAARRDKVMNPQPDPPVVYEQVHEPLEHADFDHQAAEDERQAELQRERDEHNRRTGDASLR